VECALTPPDDSVKVILFVAIFSALLCTPLALLVDWIIMYVLSAPVRKQRNTRAVAPATDLENATSVVPGGNAPTSSTTANDRKRSSLSRSIFGSVFGGLLGGAGSNDTDDAQSVSLLAQADLRQLVAAIAGYRDALHEDQRTEFDGKTARRYIFLSYFGVLTLVLICVVWLYSQKYGAWMSRVASGLPMDREPC
jgi:hypothetical protein